MQWFRSVMAMGAGLVLSTVAQAAVVTVTGGDAGQGLTLDSGRVVYAVNMAGGSSTTVQGVTFTAGHANVTQDGYTPFGADNPFGAGETSTNDNNLRSVFQSAGFFDQAAGKITISGLTASTAYDVELLVGGGGGRTMTIAYNFGSVADSQAIAANTGYNFSNTVTSQGDGTLVVNLNITSGFPNSIFSGLVVSNPVPEPASIAFVAMGGMLLAVRRRRS